MKRKLIALMALATLSAFNFQLSTARAQGTAFTYQGQLANNGLLASGSYDLKFTLFATNSAGLPVAGPVTNTATAVSNGLFTVMIDFGAGAFIGGSNWLEIGVRTTGVGGFTTLAPRQQITPTPYAITAGGVTGAIPLAQLPAALVTNDASGVNLSGAFSGNGSGLTNLAAAIAAVSGAGTNTTLTNANIAATNVTISGPTPIFSFIQTNNVGGGGTFGGQIQPYTPEIGEAIPGGNTNYNDALQIACDEFLSNNYADISFGYWMGTPHIPANFHTAGGLGVSSPGGNWCTPYLNQSNWGVYEYGSFVICGVGGDPIIFAGDIPGDFAPGDIPQMFLSQNYTHFFITDQWTGTTNYFDANKTNGNFYIPYGALITPNVYATNVTAGTFSGNGAGLTNIPFSGIQSNGGVYFLSNSFAIAQITNSLSAGGGWIGMISNVLWSYKLSNNIVVSNRLN